MLFNSGVNSLYKDAKFLCGIPDADTTTYPVDPDFTRNCNIGLDRVASLIQKYDGRFPWDDSNLTDLPIQYINITEAANFALPTAVRFLKIKIKDSNGKFIDNLTASDVRTWTAEDHDQESGTPTKYALTGGTILFNKTFNYTYAGGIEIHTQRVPDYFVVGDTTQAPGFDAFYHRLISLYAALEYCEVNGLSDKVVYIKAKIGNPPDDDRGIKGTGLEGTLCESYTNRSEDQKISLRVSGNDYGQNSGFQMSRNPFKAL